MRQSGASCNAKTACQETRFVLNGERLQHWRFCVENAEQNGYARTMSSIFSKIVAGEIPCHKVWEDERHLAFLDIHPIRPGHTLVIPKHEVDYLFDMDSEAHAALWAVAHTVAARLKETLGCARVCVAVLGYEVLHAHIHLIPTNSMRHFPWPGGKAANPEDLAALAQRLEAD